MKYFILKEDGRMYEPVRPEKLMDRINNAKDELSIQMEVKEIDKIYVDFLESPSYYLISNKLKNILLSFESEITFKQIVFLGKNSAKQSLYWYVNLPEEDCLSNKTEFFRDGKIKNLYIDESKVKSHKIFKIANVREKYFIVNLEVAEELLRENLTGIYFENVDLGGEFERTSKLNEKR